MDAHEFSRVMRLGLGRAIVHVREHDVTRYRELTLDACLHCYAYDLPSEGTRAAYMLDLLAFTPYKEFCREAVLESLPASGDDADALQRFRFATLLSLDGDARAKRLMYEAYHPGPRHGAGIGIGFLQVDGLAGFLFAARKLSALLAEDSRPDIGWLQYAAEERLGSDAVQEALRRAAERDPAIRRYRSAALASVGAVGRGLRPLGLMSAGYRELAPHISSPRRPGAILTSWGREASEADLAAAARGLLAARTAQEQYGHLLIFGERPFPLDLQPLLDLVPVAEQEVGLAAVQALAQVRDRRVRDLAFGLVAEQSPWRGEAPKLLAENFQAGDHLVGLGWFEAETDDAQRHRQGLGLLHLIERRPDREGDSEILHALYERGPCGYCRGFAVSGLLERKLLSAELRRECAWDANTEVRELAAGGGTAPS